MLLYVTQRNINLENIFGNVAQQVSDILNFFIVRF